MNEWPANNKNKKKSEKEGASMKPPDSEVGWEGDAVKACDWLWSTTRAARSINCLGMWGDGSETGTFLFCFVFFN